MQTNLFTLHGKPGRVLALPDIKFRKAGPPLVDRSGFKKTAQRGAHTSRLASPPRCVGIVLKERGPEFRRESVRALNNSLSETTNDLGDVRITIRAAASKDYRCAKRRPFVRALNYRI